MIGMPVHELLIRLLRGVQDPTAIFLFSPDPVPLLQNRLVPSSLTASILESATELRSRTSLPFWDAVNVSSFGRAQAAPDLLREALFHNRAVANRQKISVAGLTPEHLERICLSRPDAVTVLASGVELRDGSIRHLSMVDFHCPALESNLHLVVEAARTLQEHGFILKSGKSYHFYGTSLLNETQLIDHLARALLLAPIVDRAWIAHQLIERSCGLRISTREERHVPVVVAEF